MILRPFGIIVGGHLELGLEVGVERGEITFIRGHTGVPDAYVLSPAFVNAHSHLEYRQMQATIDEPDYLPWIRELTRRKSEETDAEVDEGCRMAAVENRATGVARIGEHSDRPFSPARLSEVGIGGVIFQEVITFLEAQDPEAKLAAILAKADRARRAFGGPVFLSPHAYQTVDRATLRMLGDRGEPFSMHVAETPLESQLCVDGSGGLGDLYRRFGLAPPITGNRIVPSLRDLGLCRPGAQFVHACDVDDEAIELLTRNSVSVAHCPRSNVRLRCPIAPVRRLLSAGIEVGLGMDSPASGGPIDFFAEMRCAVASAQLLGEPLTGDQVWNMATEMGFRSIPGLPAESWLIEVGSRAPLVKVHASPTGDLDEIIASAGASDVERVSTPDRT